MFAFVVRRFVAAIFLLLIVTLVTFAIFFLVPKLAGQTTAQLATQYVGRDPNPQAVQAVIKRLGLDDPVLVQYWHFVKGIVIGEDYNSGTDVIRCKAPCLGYSFRNNQPVWGLITSRLPVTASLAFGAAILWLVSGVGVGVLSALRRGSVFDRAAMTVALAGVSLPIFFTGLLSLVVFVYKLPIFPVSKYVPLTSDPLHWAYNMVLPWVTLAFLYAALYARLMRAGMLETMSEDYIRTARAKGLTEGRVVVVHAMRAAMTPILTIFGLDLGLLLGGAVLTETVFSLNGVGRLAIQAISSNDLPIVLGTVLFAAFFVVLANLVVDVLYAVLDPKVRTS